MAKSKNVEQYTEDFLRLYNEGKSLRQIAKEFGLTHGTVSRIVSKHQELRQPRGRQQEILEQVYPLYCEGLNGREIANRLGIGTNTVYNYLSLHHGVEFESEINRPKFEHLKEDFKREYLEGKTLSEIAEKYGASRQTILGYLNRQQVKGRDLKEANRNHPINDDYFDTLDKKKSRQLGMIYATGVLVYRYQTNHLRLNHRQGVEPLYVEAMDGITENVLERIHYNQKDGIAIFQLNSQKIFNQLVEWDFPNQIPASSELDLDSFWEGYLTVNTSFATKRRTLYISFATETLSNAFKEYLATKTDLITYFRTNRTHTLIFERKAYLSELFKLFPYIEQFIPKDNPLYDFKFEG